MGEGTVCHDPLCFESVSASVLVGRTRERVDWPVSGETPTGPLGTNVPSPPVALAPELGLHPDSVRTEEARGLFPLPRFCAPPPRSGRGHVASRQRRRLGRVFEANKVFDRLESLFGGRLRETPDSRPAAAPAPCGRSACEGAAAQVWEAVCTHDPPLPSREGVDALSDIAEDVEIYAVNERCDVVPRELCFSEWMSLPGGALGSFNAMDRLEGKHKEEYRTPAKLLVPEELAQEAARQTGAFVGMSRKEYAKLIRRMLGIGMVRLRRRVKVVNGIFGVWKVKPEKKKKSGGSSSPPGAGANAPPGPNGPGTGEGKGEYLHGYATAGKIRLIVDMRRGELLLRHP